MRLLKSQCQGRKSRKVAENGLCFPSLLLLSVTFRCGDFNSAAGQKERSRLSPAPSLGHPELRTPHSPANLSITHYPFLSRANRCSRRGSNPDVSLSGRAPYPLGNGSITYLTAKASKRFQREMGRVPISSSRILDPGLWIAGVTWRRHD